MTFKVLAAATLSLASIAALAQTTGTSTPNDPTTMPSPRMLKMDKNGDGVISKQEADADMLKHWDQWDVNHDGKIDAAEFAAGGVGGATPPPH